MSNYVCHQGHRIGQPGGGTAIEVEASDITALGIAAPRRCHRNRVLRSAQWCPRNVNIQPTRKGNPGASPGFCVRFIGVEITTGELNCKRHALTVSSLEHQLNSLRFAKANSLTVISPDQLTYYPAERYGLALSKYHSRLLIYLMMILSKRVFSNEAGTHPGYPVRYQEGSDDRRSRR